MKVLRVLLLLLLSTVLAKAGADDALSLQALPLWHGTLKPGQATELRLVLRSERSGRAEIRIPDHHPALRLEVELQAYLPRELPVAVHPDPAVPLRIQARMVDGGQADAEVSFAVLPSAGALVAATQALPMEAMLEQALVTVPPERLPRTAEGYETIDRLVLDADDFQRLDREQQSGLLNYAARCGSLLVVGPATSWFEALKGSAGCEGRFLDRTDTVADAVVRLRRASDVYHSPLPDAGSLGDLLPRKIHDTWLHLLLFFALYAMALLLFTRGYVRALGVPMAAGLVVWLAWSGDSAQRQLASWSEIRSGEHNLHYAALLQLTGEGRGTSRTRLPADLGLLRMDDSGDGAELLSSRSGGTLVLMTRQQLLARRSFHTHGSLPWTSALQLTVHDRGPVVENRGEEASLPALLGWNGRRHPVPSLQPGQRWSPPPESTSWQVARGEEQRLRRRTQDGSAALLLPHRLLPDGGEPVIEEQGWLLITQG